jgi:hypothetical protein
MIWIEASCREQGSTQIPLKDISIGIQQWLKSLQFLVKLEGRPLSKGRVVRGLVCPA